MAIGQEVGVTPVQLVTMVSTIANGGVYMPPHVLLPRPIGNTGGNMPHGQTAGFLGKSYDPFVLNADPSKPDSKVPDLLPPREIGEARLARRRSLRQVVDQARVGTRTGDRGTRSAGAAPVGERVRSATSSTPRRRG